MKKEKLLEYGIPSDTAELIAEATEKELKNYIHLDEHKNQIETLKKDIAVDTAINKAKGKNPKAIKALLDMDKIILKKDGTLEGLDLEEIKKTDGYLFHTVETKIVGTGFESGTRYLQNSPNPLDMAMGTNYESE